MPASSDVTCLWTSVPPFSWSQKEKKNLSVLSSTEGQGCEVSTLKHQNIWERKAESKKKKNLDFKAQKFLLKDGK